MSLNLELHLEQSQVDRVLVTVRVAPDDGIHPVDGVALQLVDPDDGVLGPRLLLPVSGTLTGPVLTHAELRSTEPIPRYSHVVATAWWGCQQIEATCPADHQTALERHMRGQAPIRPGRRVHIESLLPDERALVSRCMPWIDEPMIRRDLQQLEPLDTDAEETQEEIFAELGIEGENAEWLKELLDDEAV